MPIDTALLGALHIEWLRQQDLLGTAERPHHTLFQTSTIEALLEGKYDGDVSFAEMAERGDFGLGTLDALDGEMVALDGVFYQVRTDGKAYEIGAGTRTPFAVVTFFEPDLAREVAGPLDYAGFCDLLDGTVDDAGVCQAVRLDGAFGHVLARSVPRQRKPYPPLAKAAQGQVTFELREVEGSLVGFRFPSHAAGINVAGYHFHFITTDRTAGGHVLDLELAGGELRVDQESDLRLELPPGVDLPHPEDERPGNEDVLARIERGTPGAAGPPRG